MPVPFGFSIGDFIAVAELARDIAKALDDSRGSRAGVARLIALLYSLDRAIQVASGIFLSSSRTANRGNFANAGPLNGMSYEADRCKRLMEEFMESSRKYTEALQNGRGSNLKQSWRKITWCLFKEQDVNQLHDNLQTHIHAFEIYASASMRQSVGRTEENTTQISDTTRRTEQKATEIAGTTQRMEHKATEVVETSRRMELVMKEIFGIMKAVQHDMPKLMGYTWEGGGRMTIQLEDALGRDITLPIQLCGDRMKFQGLLRLLFDGLPGMQEVDTGYYFLADANEAIIEDSDWGHKVFPGARVSMTVIRIAMLNHAPDGTLVRCPRCSASSFHVRWETMLVECFHCKLIFRKYCTTKIKKIMDQLLHDAPRIVLAGVHTNDDAFRRMYYRTIESGKSYLSPLDQAQAVFEPSM